jgi:hypothetical protein
MLVVTDDVARARSARARSSSADPAAKGATTPGVCLRNGAALFVAFRYGMTMVL